jgi:hypothetical protein
VTAIRRAGPAPIRRQFSAAGRPVFEFHRLNLLVFSPDGSRLAYCATPAWEPTGWIQALDSGEARPLEGRGRFSTVLVTDGRSLGFFAHRS